MTTAHTIAQKLYEAGIRLQGEFDCGALVLTPDHLCIELGRLYVGNRKIPLDIEVNTATAATLGPEQAYYRAAFYQLQSDDDFSADVDSELQTIQAVEVAESRFESRSSLLREQVA